MSKMFWQRIFSISLLLGMVLSLVAPANTVLASVPQVDPQQTSKGSAVGPFYPADTSGLPPAPASIPSDKAEATYSRPDTKMLPKVEKLSYDPDFVDPVAQTKSGSGEMPAPLTNWEGMSQVGVGAGVLPPDTDGQVGPNHYVQLVNHGSAGTWVRIWDKSGNQLYDFGLNSLWPASDPCNVDAAGDPVVVYDQMADRWLLTQFTYPATGPYYECVAVSVGPDPTNVPADWYPYTFPVHQINFPDYPKFAVWPDGYYMFAHQFANASSWAGTGIWVFDRTAMLAGAAATFHYVDLYPVNPNYGGMLPANLMGNTLPPAGSPGYYVEVDQDWNGTDDVMTIFEAAVDWTGGTFNVSVADELVVAPFQWPVCSAYRGQCIDQPGTSVKLESISDRLMMHVWYRNMGAYEVMVATHTVDAGGNRAGLRWYEIRKDAGAAHWYIYQQGTFAPDTTHRWMASIAMDHVGNMAIGYSLSDSSIYPSILYTGRLAGDPLGTMTQGEEVIINGSGSQTHSAARWGDYSAMSVDPVDDCTFWYTQEYIETTGSAPWQTRVASFKFPSCSIGPIGTLDGTVTDAGTLAPIDGALIYATDNISNTGSTTSNPGGDYSLVLPVSTYDVTASAFGYLPATAVGVPIISGTVTTQDFALVQAPSFTLDGYVTDANTGWPLYAMVTVGGTPYPPLWTDPLTGYYSIVVPAGMTYTVSAAAFYPGYLPGSADVFVSGDTTQDFPLDVDVAACSAPGYTLGTSVFYSEDFESSDGGYTHSGTPDDWAWGTPTVWPDSCASGTNCWGTNLGGNYANSADESLFSPAIIVPSTGAVIVDWSQAYHVESASWDHAYAEVSINGGAYTTMWSHTGNTAQVSWTPHSYTISANAGDSLQLRFRLTSDGSINYEGYYIDDVALEAGNCDPMPGGLVVGNTYDFNTSLPLVGVTVEDEAGYLMDTIDTPLDPAIDDGFYFLFSPSGSQVFTATIAGYNPDVQTVNVVGNDTIRQDFYLDTGMLTTNPSALATSVELGSTSTELISLDNIGSAALSFLIREREKGFTPVVESAGGPDAFGYTFADSDEAGGPTYQWVDITGSGTPVTSLTDDSYAGPYNIDFPFNYYGTDQSQFYIGSNGFLSFGAGSTSLSNQCPLPSTSTPNNLIALLWDDLYPNYATGGVYYQNFPSCPIGGGACLVVEYDNWNHFGGAAGSAGTWEAILFDSGNVLIQYANAGVETGSSSTTGIEDSTGTIGLTYGANGSSCNTAASIQSNSAVCFAYPGENPDCMPADVPWFYEDVISGTIPAASSQSVNVTFDASVPEVNQPGDYLADMRILNDTVYGPVIVPVTMTVTAPAGFGKLEGTVTSLGYCDSNPAPAADANVLIESSTGMTWTLMTDANGYYQYWLDEVNSPLTVTVTAVNHTTGQATGVAVTGGLSTVVDFDLRLLEPCLSNTPDSLQTTLQLGQIDTLPVTLYNTGADSTPFTILESDGGFVPLKLYNKSVYRRSTTNTDASRNYHLIESPLAVGDVLFQFDATAATGEACILGVEYAMGSYWITSGGTSTCSTGTDNTLWQVAPDGTVLNSWNQNTTSQFGWRDLAFDGTYLYASDSGVIVQIDPATGATTGVTIPSPTNPARALAYDPATDHFWTANFSSSIWEIDRSGAIINTFPNSLAVYGAAWDMYSPGGPYLWVWSQDGNPAVLATQINPVSGAQTGVAFVGANTDGTDIAGGATISAGDLVPGKLVFIGAHQAGNDMIVGYDLDVAVNQDVPWLSESPITGTLPADTGMQVVDVTFDASVLEVTQPGDYLATLRVNSNDPGGSLVIPVTMTVTAPPDYGKLDGTVTGLGYCDANPAPLADAPVIVETNSGITWTLMTDANGYYQIWLPESESPLIVSASAPEHEPGQVSGVTVTAMMTTTVDFDLRWLQPCVSNSPDSFDVQVVQGYSLTQPLSLIDAGAASSNFKIDEISGIVAPPKAASGYYLPMYQSTVETVGSPQVVTIGDLSLSAAGMSDRPAVVTPKRAPRANSVTITHSLSQSIIQYNSVSCNAGGLHTDNSYLRVFDLDAFGLSNGFNVTSVDVGIESAVGTGGSQPAVVNLYTLNGPVAWANMTLIGSANVTVADQSLTIINMPVSADVPAGSILVVEFFTPNGQTAGNSLFIGSNNLGETGPTYLAAADCGVVEPTPTATIGFPDMHLVMNVTGELPGDAVPWLVESPITGTIGADSTFDVDITFTALPTLTVGTAYTATLKVTSDDPVTPVSFVPVTMTVIAPAYGVTLPPDEVDWGMPGETMTHTILVTNTSNGPTDSFNLTLGTHSYVTSMDQYVVGPLAAGESTTVQVWVTIPDDALEGEHDSVQFIATSVGDPGVSASMTMATYVSAMIGVELSPDTDAMDGMANDVITYTLHMTNTGNTEDTFTVSYSGLWAVNIPTTVYTLGVGEGADVMVYVTIPPTAMAGDSDVTTVTVTGTMGATDFSTLTTSSIVNRMFFPVIFR